MSDNQFSLLRQRRFAPLFVTQFLGAFHDNLFKNALVVMLIYTLPHATQLDPKILTTLAMGVFILPFVFFSATGGVLADRYYKDAVMRTIKLAELAIAALGIASLLLASVPLSFVTLFALGSHSAFFGPCKYAIVPQQVGADMLIGANALLNTGTFLAILTGTIAGTALIPLSHGPALTGTLIALCAGCGYVASRAIPPAPPIAHDLAVSFNPLGETVRILKAGFAQSRAVVLSLLGVSWFYFVGGVMMAQLPNFAHETLHADAHVLTVLLVVFSIGIGIGGLLNNRLLHGAISPRFVPAALVGISVFSFDLTLASAPFAHDAAAPLLTPAAFLSGVGGWRILADIALISICGGLFEVPLSAWVQHHTDAAARARIQAGNAVLNALFIVASAGLAAVLLAHGWSIPALFGALASVNLCVAVFFHLQRKKFVM